MPQFLDSPTRAQTVCAAVTSLIADGGMAAVTTRAIAAASGVSMATLVHQFTNRERFLGVMAGMFGRDLVAGTADRARTEGVLAFLPSTDEQAIDARVWLAWTELGRSDHAVAARVAHVRGQERLLLAATLGRSLDQPALDAVHGLVDGLRAAVCAQEEPLPPERAKVALQLGLRGLGSGA